MLCICLCLLHHDAMAAHLKGGYIEYTYSGPSPLNPNQARYRVRVYQYLECSSVGGQVDEQIFMGVFGAVDNNLLFTQVLPITSTVISSKTSFNCISNPPRVCYRIDGYEADIDLPASSTGYILAVQRCCRIANITNVPVSASSGITYSVNVVPAKVGNAFLANSSPVFTQEDTALVCAGNRFEFPFTAFDPDGDDLVFNFSAGQNTPSADAKPNPPLPPPFPPLVYSAPFAASSPMGDDVKIDTKSGLISGVAPDAAGEYVVAVTVEEWRNGVKIGEARKELHIQVGSCDIPQAVLPQRIINCDSFVVPFENNSTSSGITSYSWDFGIRNRTDDTSSLPKINFTYPDTGVYIAKLRVNMESQCPDSAETEVRIFPGFKPDFKIDGVCLQIPYQFTDLTTARYGIVNKWKWDFGLPGNLNGDTSNLRNPKYLYTDTGQYNISMYVETSKGCNATVNKVLKVDEKPAVQLAFRDTLICSIDSLKLGANGTGSFRWTPEYNIINSNTASPVVFPKMTSTYYVELNDRGCQAKDSVKVNVVNFITVDAGADTTICLTDTITLHPNSQATSYRWSPAGLFVDATAKRPLITPVDAITKVQVVANLGRCQASDSLTIRAVPYPTVNAGNDTTICFGDVITLRGSGNGTIVNWTPAATLQTPGSYTTLVRTTQTTSFTLTVSDNKGCPKPVKDEVLVTVLPKITVFAGNDTSMVYNQPLQLNARTNAPVVNWAPPLGLNNIVIINPVARISATTLQQGVDTIRYTVTASTPEGCSATDDILVKVFATAPSIFVPSGFTPNNDGLNDVMRPILAGMRELVYFRIFNRYGQLVFETKTPGKGWDGRINGIPQGSSTYVYDCRATDYNGATVQAKGSFVLVR